MKKSINLTTAFNIILLIIALSGGLIISANSAAAKTSEGAYPEYTSITIGEQETLELNILERKKDAVYTFVSSNQEIVSVDKKGLIKGLKAGNITITYKEKYKNKTSVIGKCKVTVARAEVCQSYIEADYYKEETIIIKNANPAAEYIFEAEDKEIVSVSSEGSVKALNSGKTYVKVKEKYKNKNRIIGKCRITVAKASISEIKDYKIGIGQTREIDFVKNMNPNTKYIYVTDNPDVISIEDNKIKAEGKGNTQVICYEEHAGYVIVVGNVNYTVIDIPAEKITLKYENSYGEAVFSLETGNKYDFSGDYKVYPEDVTDKTELFSSDTMVADIDENGIVTAKNPGEADIIVKNGQLLKKCRIAVRPIDMSEMGIWARSAIKLIDELKKEEITNENVKTVYEKLILLGDGLYEHMDMIWEEAAKEEHYLVVPNYNEYTKAVENFYTKTVMLDGIFKSGFAYNDMSLVRKNKIIIDFKEKCTNADIVIGIMNSYEEKENSLELEVSVYNSKNKKISSGKLKIVYEKNTGEFILEEDLKNEEAYTIEIDYGEYKLEFKNNI